MSDNGGCFAVLGTVGSFFMIKKTELEERMKPAH